MPFLQFARSHIAGSHFSSWIAESSKMVFNLDGMLLAAITALPAPLILEPVLAILTGISTQGTQDRWASASRQRYQCTPAHQRSI